MFTLVMQPLIQNGIDIFVGGVKHATTTINHILPSKTCNLTIYVKIKS